MEIDAAAPASSALALEESVSEATGNREVFDLDKQPDSASAWLDLVRQLVDQGLEEDARQQFQAFRSAHPDYPLPLWAQEWSENLDE